MLNFQFKNPTKILFGKGQLSNLAQLIPAAAKVLMIYGGGSIFRNGIYDSVKNALSGHTVIEFGGITANPEYEVLLKAVDIIKSEKITYLLGVGGGSVIDGTKFLSIASCYEGTNPWDILSKKLVPERNIPFGTVLTLPGTGSEMNPRAVITRSETHEKLSIKDDHLFPVFSILDPSVIRSVPRNQLANGLADSFMHVLEQYLTYPVGALLQDRFAESILQTIINVAPQIMSDASNYEAACDFIWSSTLALNDLIAQGVPSDWTIHKIGHELTAIHHIDHARTLAILAGSYYRYTFEAKKEKLAQYAASVWHVRQGTIEEMASEAIEHTVAFFHSLDIQTQLSMYTSDYQATAATIAETFEQRGWTALGERNNITPADVLEIVKQSY
ncbi:NADP-dependent alcohol dehydrogenase [Chitinophaga sp. YR627]|uniref:iron-containing alcohol dehydrogenase n=1 Tax=Chitinophaga sp. YR627 TaxID=1881041 RepID=UPI0008E51CA6|nr:iron-containing alcohol dehydrogenase [Chitinophaga sp. YR627]SFM74979.1 NADP-dependent alcohol dehydrogenase [Chitinophaga sp. YR627]